MVRPSAPRNAWKCTETEDLLNESNPQSATFADHAAMPRGRRIIFVNRFFYPDHSATSQILSDLAFHLAEHRRVHVITSRQRYDDAHADLPANELIKGVSVHRLSTTRFGRSGLLTRGFDYLSFARAMRRAVHTVAEPGDILVAKTDPPLLGVLAMRMARRRGLRLINWLKDLYPEVATALGVPFTGGTVARTLLSLRDAGLRAAVANVVICERMADVLGKRGIAPDRISLIPDWSDDEAIRPVPHTENPLRRDWQLEDSFVLCYSGNLGKGHEFDTIIKAAERLRRGPAVIFLFIGGGQRFGDLVRCVRQRGLDPMFRFLPYQPRDTLRYSLGVADMHLVSLKPELEGLMLPCKLYGIAAAGRPVVAIASPEGDVASLVHRHACGVVIPPGEGELLANALGRLIADPHSLAEMGRRARRMIDTQFTRRQALARWDHLLSDIG